MSRLTKREFLEQGLDKVRKTKGENALPPYEEIYSRLCSFENGMEIKEQTKYHISADEEYVESIIDLL